MEAFKGSMAAMANQSMKRSVSRASTTSLRSANTQGLDQSFEQVMFPSSWLSEQPQHHSHHSMHQHHAQMPQMGGPYSPESELLLHAIQSGPQMPNPGLQPSHVNHMTLHQYSQHPGMAAHSAPILQHDNFPNASTSFSEHDGRMLDREDDDASLIMAKPAAKGTRSSANNELEMRQLFSSNKNRTLQEVASELHGNERGPNSERTRQVFAMLWINQTCTKGKGSVPRGRVYANYAERCAVERITVLNPASFGKLVRVLFPGLKTRRLGVRGESKYHYVNFMLLEDRVLDKEPSLQPALPLPLASQNNGANGSAMMANVNGNVLQNFNVAPLPPASTASTMPQHSQVDRNVFPSPETQSMEASFNIQPPIQHGVPTRSVYNVPNVDSVDQVNATTAKTCLHVAFGYDLNRTATSDPIVLPPLEPFLPPGTDPDAVKSLAALYRSHCTSLVECIRYCREKTFFHLFTSFQGTLTMPVQKLFANPAISQWIEECDFMLYQRMMQIVATLILQVIPKPVLDTFRNISERLVPHIRESFHGQPTHVVQAKEAPAALFSSLLDRILRVNLTAHAAANMLANPANRDQMYLDWITLVRLKKVAESVPTRGMDDCVSLLLLELKPLLEPVNVPWEIETLTVYGDVAARTARPDAPEGANNNTQSVLDRWVNLLHSLPSRFPYARPIDIVAYVQCVGTAAMRDLTINQGKSFGSWWVTKCWVDEMVNFMAELGGFMQQKSSKPSAGRSVEGVTSTSLVDVSQTSYQPSPDLQQKHEAQQLQQAMASEMQQQQHLVAHQQHEAHDLHLELEPHTQPDRAPFPCTTANSSTATMTNPTDMPDLHDDSGIGIHTPDEEFAMHKFELPTDGLDLTLDPDSITLGA